MAHKGNQQKNGLDRHSFNHKRKVTDAGYGVLDAKGRGQTAEVKTVAGEELPNGNQASNPLTGTANKTSSAGDEKKSKQRSGKSLRKDKQEMGTTHGLDRSVSRGSDPRESDGNVLKTETCGIREENVTSPRTNSGSKHPSGSSGCSPNGLPSENAMKNPEFSDTMVVRSLRASALSILKAANEWFERQKPFFISLSTKILNVRDLIRMKIEQTYPIILKQLMYFGNIMLLLSMVWLDCTIRGIDSFLRMGTTSFFSVIWCSIFSVVAMIGMSKFLIILIVSVLMGVFRGFAFGSLVIAISGVVIWWIYGSFWLTALITFGGGLAFTLKHERVALLLTTMYSVYCAWAYVGWLGLIVALNLSFISSDALIYLLKNSANEHRRSSSSPEQTDGVRGRPGFFNGEQPHASSSETGSEQAPDRSAGVTSTSGADSEITSEEEVVRLLNCTDHYSALGLSRFENIDVSLLKREYRKKAMLVHPDKNMGNEKAAEAFKKLQNAYEILLDSLKRKAYDDELRREELLNCFRRFQTASQKNGRHGPFTSGFTRSESEVDDPFGESRRIACKKCGHFHVWVHTKKSKSRARWCQDCKDFHPAKDGDGWVEQSTQPFFFGILQKVDAPSAYVCAESRIYNATEWYICQGMRCPANTHKPSFHVNTSVTSKHNNGSKGTSSGQKGGMPPPNMEENMTEEEFFEWLQNAVQAGMFDTGGGSSSTSAESPSAKAGNFPKSGGPNSGSSSSGSKRKKKGKKQR